MTQEEIFAKAEAINEEQIKKRRHVETCVRANICPECGEELVEKWKGDENILICNKTKPTHFKKTIGWDDCDEQ